MTNINGTLRELMQVKGVRSASAVDYYSRLLLASVGQSVHPDLDKAAQANTDVVRAKLFTLEFLGYGPHRIQDILVTLTDEYHLIRPLSRRSYEGVFLYVVLDRATADLTTVKQRLRSLEDGLDP